MNWLLQFNRKQIFSWLGTLLVVAAGVTQFFSLPYIYTGPQFSMWGFLSVFVMACAFIINVGWGWSWFWVLTAVLVAICGAALLLDAHTLGVCMAVIAALEAGAGLAILMRQRDDFAK